LLQKLSILLWSIWKGWNHLVFKNENFIPLARLISAKKSFAEWRTRSCISVDDYSRRLSSPSVSHTNHLVRWFPPPPGTIKINFDGSCINSAAAGGFILRDHMGRIIKVGAANYGLTSSLIAEARALKDGILLAVQARYSRLSIDNLIVIQALKGECKVPWQIAHIIADVKAILHRDIQVSI